MLIYLLKVTGVWLVLLLLFEAFFRHSGRFLANRLYLTLSIAAGLLLPLVSVPDNVPVAFGNRQQVSVSATPHIVASSAPATIASLPKATATTQPHNAEKGRVDLPFILLLIYSTGAVLLLAKCVMELFRIALLLRDKPRTTIDGHTLIITARPHAPYSFAGYIFIEDPAQYTAQELAYIIRHEAAHQQQRHQLDLWLLQLTCIAFWFHPLAWRTRYRLR